MSPSPSPCEERIRMKRIGFRIRLGLASVEENDQEKKEDQEDQDGLGFGSKSDSEWESNQIRSQDLDKRQVSSTPRFHPLLPHRRELGEPGYNNVSNACVCAGLLQSPPPPPARGSWHPMSPTARRRRGWRA